MKKTTIRKNAYDTLELSALAYNGIGGCTSYDDAGDPYCISGHIAEAAPWDVIQLRRMFPQDGLISGNDEAVQNINQRLGFPIDSRVTWEQYVEERGWVRGNR